MSTDNDEDEIANLRLDNADSLRSTRYCSAHEPKTFDVLCGRGRDCYEHVGNKEFRDMIDANVRLYEETTTKHERGTIVTGIVRHIRKNGGNFLRFDNQQQTWIELPEYEARQKVGQTIREVLTQRDPAKRAASLNRKATNKGRRVVNISTNVENSSPTDEIAPALTNVAAVFRSARTPTRTTSLAQKWTISDVVTTPDSLDILCGRGADFYDHPGNHLFRQVISAALPRYIEAETKHAKGTIVSSLVDALKRASPNGFLKYCDTTMTWMKLDNYSSRQKVGQTIREALTHRDPEKQAANRERRAMNKAKRSTKGSHDRGHLYQRMDSQLEQQASPSDADVDTDWEKSSEDCTSETTDVESHPLESILIAMTVQRQRETPPVDGTT